MRSGGKRNAGHIAQTEIVYARSDIPARRIANAYIIVAYRDSQSG